MNPRVLIVDDEPLARSKLLRLLRRRDDATVIGACRSAAQAVEAIREGQPDLVFLDIQLPDQSGFWVLEEVGAMTVPAVVFVTAYDAFALRAFEAHAIDYLLKPFDASRFERAYDRARTWLGALTREPPTPGSMTYSSTCGNARLRGRGPSTSPGSSCRWATVRSCFA